MKNKTLAIMAVSGSLLAGSVNAAVNTETSMAAPGAVTFTSALITAHSITDTAAIAAGQQPAVYQLVGTGSVTTDTVGTIVAVKPAANVANNNPGYVPSRDLWVPGTQNPAQNIILSISTTAENNSTPAMAGNTPGWSVLPDLPTSNQVSYYIVMPGNQNIPADTYSYTIDAATYNP